MMRFSGVADWIYACVISLVRGLRSPIEAVSQRMRFCVSLWTVGAFVAMEVARSSTLLGATNWLL